MQIERITVRLVRMPLRQYFETSFGRQYHREFLLVEVESNGAVGYGEVATNTEPLYNEETTYTALSVLERSLIPRVLALEFERPEEVAAAMAPIRRNNFAKAGLELAVWDLCAKLAGQPLSRYLGGDPNRTAVPVGISIGIQESVEALLEQIEAYLAQGYRRIKVKIKPGWDYEVIRAIRERFGDIPLMADANSAYTLADIDLFRRLDEFGLMMIEQPLDHDDIVDHAKLQAQIRTPICLDESIHSPEDVRRAVELGSCRIINVKVGRVGGLTAVKAIDAAARRYGIPLWCGGMLESGVGRAHNLHLTTLPGFVLPGDTAASSRYWEQDIIDPPVTLNPDGTVTVPTGPGIGVRVLPEVVQSVTLEKWEYHRRKGGSVR